jgi:hypothetical protein
LSHSTSLRSALEVLLKYEPSKDYSVIKISENRIALRVINADVASKYGRWIEVEEPSKCLCIMLLAYIGDQTTDLLLKYKQAFDKLSSAGFSAVLLVYDCDVETARFVYLIDAVSSVLGGELEVVAKASSAIVASKKYAEFVKSIKAKELADTGYYEYQRALQELSRHLYVAVKLLGSPSLLEQLLAQIETPVASKSRYLESFFGKSVRYYREAVPGECPESLLEAVKRAWSTLGTPGRTYLVSTQVIARVTTRVVQPDYVVEI